MAAKLTKASLSKRGAKLGLDTGLVAQWLQLFGPLLTDLLLKYLEGQKDKPKITAKALGLDALHGILVYLLVDNKAIILAWLEQGESAIFDAFAGLIAGRAPVLAALLARYKQVVLGSDDQVAIDLIDELVTILQQTPATS